jgi:hypothetical protein
MTTKHCWNLVLVGDLIKLRQNRSCCKTYERARLASNRFSLRRSRGEFGVVRRGSWWRTEGRGGPRE